MRVELTIGKKVLGAMAASTALLVAVGLLSWWSAGRITDRLREATEQKIPGLQALGALEEGQLAVDAALATVVDRRASPGERAAAAAEVSARFAAMDAAATFYGSLHHHDNTLELWRAWKEAYAAWRSRVEGALAAGAERDRLAGDAERSAPALAAAEERAARARAAAAGLSGAVHRALAADRGKTLADSARAREAGLAAATRSAATIAVAVLLAAALLVVAGWSLSRQIAGTIAAFGRQAGILHDGVVAGRLDVRADPAAVDPEFRPLVEGMNEPVEAFARLLRLASDHLARLARGDLPPPFTERFEGGFATLAGDIDTCVATVARLEGDARALAAAALAGRLDERADAARHEGAYRRILEGMNATTATLVGHLDAMPAPAMVIDRDFRIRYLNAAGLALAGVTREAAIGARCADLLKTADCGTERCACARAMRDGRPASSETVARPAPDRVFEIGYSAAPIRDGGEVVGAFEVFSDQTVVRGAMRRAEKVARFQAEETARVVDALQRLSRGDLATATTVADGDADTAGARDAYRTIGAAIERSAAAVRALVADARTVAAEAVAGKLSARADPARHEGEFRAIVEGMNATLDAVLAPVEEATGALEALARRDLSARVRGAYAGDHARIKDAVNATAEALHDALAQVAAAVEQVSSAATQIAASSQAVASGASEQAAALQETSSSLESVSSMTRHAADSATQANGLARTARDAASDGAATVERMQGAMGKIRASAEATSQIIRDINDIAFQTNLLALNAAVEAARAGDAGRGFAVVAEEVRSLALRAKEAATKTEALIRESVKQAGEGEATATQVAGKLGEIVGGISKVSDIVSEIAATAGEQTAGIDQVHRAVSEMDKVTQQNAASAEESSSAAAELSGQAEELAAMVGAFHLARGEGAAPVAGPRRGGLPGKLPGKAPALAAVARPAPGAAGTSGARPPPPPPRARPDADRLFPMDDETVLRDF